MDFLMNMLSLAKDMNGTEKQLKKLSIEIKYQIKKAQRLLNIIDDDNGQHDISFMLDNLKLRIKQAQIYAVRFDQLLEEQKFGLKEKIKLNLPFDQTKKQASSVLQNIGKAISDVNNQISNSSDVNGGIKKKINQVKILSPVGSLSGKDGASDKEIDEQLQEIYQMGPTIRQDQIMYSQKGKQPVVQFTIQIDGKKQLIETLQQSFPNLLSLKVRVTSEDKIEQKLLYTVARLNYKTAYKKIKEHTKQIDGISTNGHFHFVLKNVSTQNNGNCIQKPRNSQKQLSLPIQRNKSSQQSQAKEKQNKQNNQQEMFFSFPEDNGDFFSAFKMLMRKEDPKKSVYIFKEQSWVKIDEDQCEIKNGEQLAAFIDPKDKVPAIYFRFLYQILNN